MTIGLRSPLDERPAADHCEIIAEKADFLSRPKAAEDESPELVDRDDVEEEGWYEY